MIVLTTFFATSFNNGVRTLSWNQTSVSHIINISQHLICTPNYMSGTSLPNNLFGVLPANLISYMTITPYDWCHSIWLQRDNGQCKQFQTNLNTTLINTLFHFPER